MPWCMAHTPRVKCKAESADLLFTFVLYGFCGTNPLNGLAIHHSWLRRSWCISTKPSRGYSVTYEILSNSKVAPLEVQASRSRQLTISCLFVCTKQEVNIKWALVTRDGVKDYTHTPMCNFLLSVVLHYFNLTCTRVAGSTCSDIFICITFCHPFEFCWVLHSLYRCSTHILSTHTVLYMSLRATYAMPASWFLLHVTLSPSLATLSPTPHPLTLSA